MLDEMASFLFCEISTSEESPGFPERIVLISSLALSWSL